MNGNFGDVGREEQAKVRKRELTGGEQWAYTIVPSLPRITDVLHPT
jgi:hypothetical protein